MNRCHICRDNNNLVMGKDKTMWFCREHSWCNYRALIRLGFSPWRARQAREEMA